MSRIARSANLGPVSSANVTRIDVRPTDADLVRAAIAGRHEAFRELFDRYVRYAAGLAYRLMGSDDEVDDIVQASFADALDKLGSLRDPQAFAAWLAAIVTTRALKKLRRRRLLNRLLLRSNDENGVPDPLRSSTIASADVIAELHAVNSLVQALPPEERVAFLLCRVEELTHAETAARLGCSIATVKRRVERAERHLRDSTCSVGGRA